MHLRPTSGDTFKLDSKEIRSIREIHSYRHDALVPFVTAEISVARAKAAMIIMQRKDMQAEYKLYTVNEDAGTKTLLFHRKLMCMVHADSRIEKEMGNLTLDELNNASFGEEVKVTLSLELESVFNYELLKAKSSLLLNDVDMSSVLLTVAGTFNFKQVYIPVPDNTEVYDNVVLAPAMSLLDILDELQYSPAYKGIYNDGVCVFVENEVLYILPKFIPVESPRSLDLFIMGNNGLYVADCTTGLSESTCKVIVTDPIKTTSSAQKDTEHANAIQTIDQTEIYNTEFEEADGLLTITPTGEFITFGATDTGATIDGYRVAVMSNRNSASAQERLYTNGLIQHTILWRDAIPGIIHPNTLVNLHTLNSTGFDIAECVLGKAEYLIAPEGTADGSFFSCTATLTVLDTFYE